MAYDVFLVSALEDRDMAKLITRRLRALKFKVWLDQKQTDDTFDAKDARDAMNSQSMLVLWSENAVKSDWVRAAASIGHSRAGMLVQTGLDKTIPYEPFKLDKRYKLEGMTSRKIPQDFYKVVEELGRRDGRTDLRKWMDFGTRDDDKRAKWLADHPTDPLAIAEKKKRERKLGIKPAPAADAASASALAAASVTSRPAATKTSGGASATAAARTYDDDEDMGVSWGTILAIMAAIAGMLFLGWLARSQPLTQRQSMQAASGTPYIVDRCPAGTAPASLFQSRRGDTD